MPRYELIEGSSNKFWEISLEGNSFTTTYGRIGTEGQSSLKEYESEEKAKKEYDKLIAEKTKKGYALVNGAGAPVAAESKAEAKAAPVAEAKPKAAPAADKPKKAVFDDEGEDEDEDEPAPKKKVAQSPPKAAAKAPAPAATSSKSTDAGARYFEFVDGSSSKFWEINLEGTSFTTRYGKIGTEGQTSMKEYDSEEKAQRECEKLVVEKTKKGYVQK